MIYKLRFKYNGTWTRWFNEGEDLSEFKDINIEMAQVHEEMTYEEYYKWKNTKC